MPELPEVETLRRALVPALEGQWVSQVIIRQSRLRWPVPEMLAHHFPGQQVKRIHRRGKYLLFECCQGYLLIHLGMSGSLRLLSPVSSPQKHDHIDIIFRNHQCLRYHDPRRFGCILWISESPWNHPLLAHLGPEPLEDSFTGKYLYQEAQGRRVAVKNYIMDAHQVVGVGNIYANEALFLAGIHPNRQAGEIGRSAYQKLVKCIKQVLQKAIEQGGTTLRDYVTLTGHPGDFKNFLNVYGRAQEACVRCGHPVQYQKMGQRSSYFCSNCQK